MHGLGALYGKLAGLVVVCAVLYGGYLVAVHAYTDHQTFHRVIAWVNAADAEIVKLKTPPAPGSANPVPAQ